MDLSTKKNCFNLFGGIQGSIYLKRENKTCPDYMDHPLPF